MNRKGSVQILGIVGVLALVLVLPVAIFMVGQNQNPSSQASVDSSLPQNGPIGYVVEDSFVDSDNPGKNFGSAPVLWSDGESKKITYIKFNLESLAGKNIQSAILKLFVNHASEGEVLVKVVPVSSWTGGSITYNVRPLAEEVIASINGGSVGEWVEVDLTQFVQQNVGKVVSVAIESNDPNGLSFNSLESPFDKIELDVQSN